MEIQQKEDGQKGAFVVEVDGKRLAEMSYALPEKGIMAIEHTEVDDELRGKSVGMKMLNQAAEYARAHNMKIIPYCPFVKSVFEKKEEQFRDVWKKRDS